MTAVDGEVLAATVLALVDKGDARGVADALAGATPAQRRAVAAAVTPLAAVDQWEAWQRRDEVGALIVAGVACLPTAAQVATWLGRRSFSTVEPDIDAIVDTLVARQVPWLPDLATRLAGALTGRTNTPHVWRLAAGVVLAAGVPPPTGDQFVLGWLSAVFSWNVLERRGARDALRADPFLDALLPHMFEVDGAGALMTTWSGMSARTGREEADLGVLAFASLAAEGRLARPALLDGCLSRFLKGDRPSSVRVFVSLHAALAPTVDEIAERRDDYARLLPDAPASVATLAQKALRALDTAGRLGVDVVLRSGRDVLFRPDRGLVRTQLSWLDSVARRCPERAGEVLIVVADAFAHPTLDVQERALAVVGRHLSACDPAVRVALAVAAGRRVPPQQLPAPPQVRPMPPPIGTPSELAAEATALFSAHGDMIAWERVLAATVSLAAADRAALRASLEPVTGRFDATLNQPDLSGITPLGELILHVLLVLTRDRSGSLWQAMVGMARAVSGRGTLRDQVRSQGAPTPHLMMVWRTDEIGLRIDREPVPALLATPTTTTGHIDPATLVDRVAAAERDGWRPWPVDLSQALLRLPRTADPEVVARAGRLRSPAGRRLAERLAAGPVPDPATEPVARRRGHFWLPALPSAPELPLLQLVPTTGTGDPVSDEMFHNNPTEHWRISLVGSQHLWPAVLPSHREVVAAHLLPDVATGPEFGNVDACDVLPALAECAGPCGPAMAAALAYALGAARESSRVAGVDAALTLAATGDLDGAAVGRALAGQLAAGATKLPRITAALDGLAAGGATAATWAIASTVLAAVLVLPKPPPATPDLLALASRVVVDCPDAGLLPELATVAARTGTSRLVTEARRLHRLLQTGRSGT